MTTVIRARELAVPAEAIWQLVSDPQRLHAWWPGVQRVEEATPQAWTTVLASPTGKTVRADYTLLESQHERLLSWRQEVEESPFERILAESTTALELEPERDTTRVTLTTRLRARGFARFGFWQLRRATARQLEAALDGLEAALGTGEG
jgi:carbon monoxide dehydrogenase subunit G